jgi:hypothetical protein
MRSVRPQPRIAPPSSEYATARRLPTSRSPSRRRPAVILGLAAAGALFLFFPGLIALVTDWWWFQEIGYQVVFSRTLMTRVLLFFLAGGLAAGLLYFNLRIAQRGLRRSSLVREPLVPLPRRAHQLLEPRALPQSLESVGSRHPGTLGAGRPLEIRLTPARYHRPTNFGSRPPRLAHP